MVPQSRARTGAAVLWTALEKWGTRARTALWGCDALEQHRSVLMMLRRFEASRAAPALFDSERVPASVSISLDTKSRTKVRRSGRERPELEGPMGNASVWTTEMTLDASRGSPGSSLSGRAPAERDADTQTHRHTGTQAHRHTDTQTHRYTDTRTDTQTHRHTEIQTHRDTDNTDTQTRRHTDTQTHM